MDADYILDWDENVIENAFLENQVTEQNDSNVLFLRNNSLVFFSNANKLSMF